MLVQERPRITAFGHEVDTRPEHFGALRSSSAIRDDGEALRERMAEDGYLYLPGYFDREQVLAARLGVATRLAEEELLEPGTPILEAVARRTPVPGKRGLRTDLLAKQVEPLQQLLYAGRMVAFYERLLGGAVRHFDYTWLRVVKPGLATPPHMDIVFMGRGTPNLYTAWTPLSDISPAMGGLMILEGSHRLDRVKDTYGRRDVDTYCTNLPHANGEAWASGQKRWSGHLSKNAVQLREKLGGRWLTNEFRMGDLLTFAMFTVHASLDNQTDRIRLSTDSRYQSAADPADPRWVGEQPIAHGVTGRRGRIC
jgi:ectoine hydroxylase-related dioxygenase (phytanoyl-CoA dioxygenase family)